MSSFLLESLKKHHLRLSGRLPSHFRSFDLKFHSPYHVLLSLGDTIVTCRLVATVEKVPPTASKSAQSQGQFKLQVEYQNQRKRDIERLVDRILRGSKALDLEELCILVGQWVWHIEMNVRIVRMGGNELDATVLGIIALLIRYRRPHIEIHVGDESEFDREDEMFLSNEEKIKKLLEKEHHSSLRQRITIHDGGERDPIPLSVHHIPLSVTFALFSSEENPNQLIYVMDPDLEEQNAAEGIISVAVNTHGEICSIEKSGGVALSPECIIQCVKLATLKVKELSSALLRVVEADIKQSVESKKKKYTNYNDTTKALREHSTHKSKNKNFNSSTNTNTNQKENENDTDSNISDISDMDSKDEIILPTQEELTKQQRDMLLRMAASEDSSLDEEQIHKRAQDAGMEDNEDGDVPLVPLSVDSSDTEENDEDKMQDIDIQQHLPTTGKSWKEVTKSKGAALDLSAAILPRKKKH